MKVLNLIMSLSKFFKLWNGKDVHDSEYLLLTHQILPNAAYSVKH